jgi:hypothetical protein
LLGPRSAPNVLYALTGVHGAEGFSGAAAMLKFMLEMGNADSVYLLPPDTRYVFHHMVEPWGASFGFKENEDNVDQLKNGNDLYEETPGWNRTNPIFVELIDKLDIPHIDSQKGTDPPYIVPLTEFYNMGVKYGEAFGEALRKGQMQRQVGMSYWGTAQSWSSSVQRQVAEDYLSGAAKVVVLDLHTAVGTYGEWSLYGYDLHSEAVFKEWIALAGIDKTMVNLNEAGVSLDPWPFYNYIEKITPSTEMVRVVWEAGTYPQDQYQLYLVLGIHCRFYMATTSYTPAECAGFEAKISQYFYPNFDDYKEIAIRDLAVASKALFAGMRSWFAPTASPSAAPTTALAPASSSDVSPPAVAGIAVACAVVGLMLGYTWVKNTPRAPSSLAGEDGNKVELTRVRSDASMILRQPTFDDQAPRHAHPAVHLPSKTADPKHHHLSHQLSSV